MNQPSDVISETTVTVPDPDRMRELGRALAALLRPGDLVVLTGELGAGKTTLTRGIGEGLGVRGQVTSPTFVIARVHPPLGEGPALVHADAYRLGGGLDELEDLDLDAALGDSVVVVEWGEGRVEDLAEDRLHLTLRRPAGEPELGDGADEGGAGDEERTVIVTGVGPRWDGTDLAALAGRGGAGGKTG
ncbi:tRNA (adenosine(37)-N6)-threonylcarbamoyltransferase complex ATPase subunit type 1 TsaE [Streptomyces sp. B6B3]|uniref:tRNA (adenosine(37)-N6)-threonylcarbamoyltransferase complex ATPase subunit type 1 TsaE n=1 Tax=Streptomyces sp. B6B3 TaxID=3153570 RepID=UPI00325F6DBB